MNRNQAIKRSLLLLGIFVALGCETPRSSAQVPDRQVTQVTIQSMPLDRIKEQEKLPEYLRILNQADRVDSSAIGFAAIRSETYKAYERALAAGSSIRPQLEAMMQFATPAGRIYAAILLQRIDRNLGENALKQLQSDNTQITYLNGCIGENYKVSEFATKVLQGQMSL